jgi:Circadian oscillating protein COP23
MKRTTLSNIKSMRKPTHSLTNILLLSVALLGATATLFQATPVKAQVDEARFYCGSSYNSNKGKKVPTTVVWRPTGKTALVQWVKPMDNYWTPERRCNEFSQRITAAYQNKTLNFLTNGKMKGQRVICTANEVNGDCKDVLMTLRPQDKSLKILDELKDLLNGKSTGGPVIHNSGEAQLYYQIDMSELLKKGSQAE